MLYILKLPFSFAKKVLKNLTNIFLMCNIKYYNFLLFTIKMLSIDSFNRLELDDKIHYLWNVLHHIVKHDEEWEKNLEIFLFGSSDKDLVEFYEVLLNPEKADSYIERKWKAIKEWNTEMQNLENLLNHAKIEMQECMEKEDVDEVLNQI